MQVTRKLYLLGVAFGACLVVTSCQTVQTTRSGVVGVDRPQQMSVFTPSEAEVAATARQQYLQVMQGAAHKGRSQSRSDADRTRAAHGPATDPAHGRVPRRRGALAMAGQCVDLERGQCLVHARRQDGGVYGPALRSWSSPTMKFAAVMGHEIAHALREHVRERMGRQQATEVGTAVGSAVLEYFTGVNPGQLGHTFTQAMFVLPHSREQEQEADRIGVELAARAGYDPRAAVSLWQKWRPAAAGSRRSGCRRIRRTRRASVTCRTMRSACCPCIRAEK